MGSAKKIRDAVKKAQRTLAKYVGPVKRGCELFSTFPVETYKKCWRFDRGAVVSNVPDPITRNPNIADNTGAGHDVLPQARNCLCAR